LHIIDNNFTCIIGATVAVIVW